MKERHLMAMVSKPNASTLTGRSTTMLMSTLLRWHLDLVLLGAVLTGLALLLRAWANRAHGATVPLRELVPMLILVLVATEVYAQVNTRREVSRMEYMLVGYVQTYAAELQRLGAARVSADTAAEDHDYLALIEQQKRWLAHNTRVADIYTFGRARGGRLVLLVDSETDYDREGAYEEGRAERTAIGEPYPWDDPIRRAFQGQTLFDPTVTTDRWGTFISAYAPMKEGDKVVGVVGVDFPAGDWLHGLFVARLDGMLVGGILFLCMTAVTASMLHARSRAEAQVDIRARDAFLANVSHEIRTPLTGILGVVELLLDSDLKPVQRRQAELLRDSGESLLGIINDLLDYSKLRATTLRLQHEPLYVDREIQAVLNLERPRAERKGLRLLWEVPEEPVPVMVGDPLRVRQILTNLIGNAVKFTVRGQVSVHLRVEVRPVEDGATPSVEVVVDVIDTGIGISREVASRLFKPFEQGDPRTTRRFGGTGLGLALTRDLVHQMDGTLDFSSRPGKGTTFTLRVTLPLGEQEPAQTPQPAPVPLRRLRVLVAEDAPVNRAIIKDMLEADGHEVELVVDGGDAVLRCAVARFDLILMDQHMPRMDGITATHVIRKAESVGQRTPIIAFTASAMPTEQARCLEAGMDDVLPKPFTREQLRRVLRRWGCGGTG